MANIQSKKKHIRQSIRRTANNRHIKSTLRTLRKSVSKALEGDNKDVIDKCVSSYVSALDNASKRGAIHSNKANRHKSAIAKKSAIKTI